MADNYWSKVLEKRVGRRRAMAATGAAGLGAAFLAACGSSDSGSGGGETDSGLLTQPSDSLKTAKRGGVMKDRTFGDTATLDPFSANNTLNAIEGQVMSSLVNYKPGYKEPSQFEIIPDLMESWETSPDGLTITMKMRQGVKWHNKAPVNGRTMDVDDIIFGWNRFATKASSRGGIANVANPDAPVLSLTATDANTVVMKLKEPIVHALPLFASNFTGNIAILPKEADSAYDPRNEMIGTGPFMLSNYTPSVGFTLKRHADYWDKDYALVDTVETPIVLEYAAALAQFKAGNIYSFGSYRSVPIINPDDVLPTKREEPRIQIYQGDLNSAGLVGVKISFGWLPDGKSIFLDERVRQAVSMGWDRDLYMETFFNIKKFESEGLPVESYWNSALQAEFTSGYLDPRSKDFGPNARYFEYNPTEAKKLLASAGYPNGVEVVSNYVTGPEIGTTAKHAEVLDGFARDIGITIKQNSLDYVSQYMPKFRDGKGQYEGWTYISVAGAPHGNEPIAVLANEYWSKGASPAYHGFSTNGRNDKSGDPQVDALIEKGRIERDTEKRRAIAHDLQRYLAKPMYAISAPGMAAAFTVAWPALSNFRLYRYARSNYQLWIDETKAPIAKA